jgi:hypothetical protein
MSRRDRIKRLAEGMISMADMSHSSRVGCERSTLVKAVERLWKDSWWQARLIATSEEVREYEFRRLAGY